MIEQSKPKVSCSLKSSWELSKHWASENSWLIISKDQKQKSSDDSLASCVSVFHFYPIVAKETRALLPTTSWLQKVPAKAAVQ